MELPTAFCLPETLITKDTFKAPVRDRSGTDAGEGSYFLRIEPGFTRIWEPIKKLPNVVTKALDLAKKPGDCQGV